MEKISLEQFMRQKLAKADESHTILFLKKIQLEKDLENLNEQILMLEGAHQYVHQFLAEWELHNKKIADLKNDSINKEETTTKE